MTRVEIREGLNAWAVKLEEKDKKDGGYVFTAWMPERVNDARMEYTYNADDTLLKQVYKYTLYGKSKSETRYKRG